VSDPGTIFLVDDDEALRRATRRLLDVRGFAVREYASAAEFLADFDPRRAGCLLLDVRMPGTTGFELQEELMRRGTSMPIVFLTGHADVPSSVQAMKHGAVDLLQKPVREADLIAAIERALERDSKRRADDAQISVLRRRHDSLTPREKEILVGVVAGQLNKQVAFSLGIAERTVKLHRARVLEKMRAESLAELVRMAQALGIHETTR
jgi:two-component system response regulator FixJ